MHEDHRRATTVGVVVPEVNARKLYIGHSVIVTPRVAGFNGAHIPPASEETAPRMTDRSHATAGQRGCASSRYRSSDRMTGTSVWLNRMAGWSPVFTCSWKAQPGTQNTSFSSQSSRWPSTTE